MYSALSTEDPQTSSKENMFDPVEICKLNINLEKVVESEGLPYAGGTSFLSTRSLGDQ